MGMFGQVKSAINSILPKLFTDEDLTTSVIWKRFESSDWNDLQGLNVDTYTEFPLTSIKPRSMTELQRSVVFPSLGRTKFSNDSDYIFQYGDMPSGATNKDLLVEGGSIYQVEKISPVFGLIVCVSVKGYA